MVRLSLLRAVLPLNQRFRAPESKRKYDKAYHLECVRESYGEAKNNWLNSENKELGLNDKLISFKAMLLH